MSEENDAYVAGEAAAIRSAKDLLSDAADQEMTAPTLFDGAV